MFKRITYLEKHSELSLDQFFAHWATTHADIARELPGVTCYLQNHVHSHSPTVEAGESFRIDGIVELWFDSPEVGGASHDSAVAERLIDDELRFLSGLTGGPVEGGEPQEHRPFKVWVLGLGSLQSDLSEAAAWLDSTAEGMPGEIGRECNRLAENPQLLLRDSLRHEPRIPDVALALGFATAEEAEFAAQSLVSTYDGRSNASVENIHVYLASEVAIL